MIAAKAPVEGTARRLRSILLPGSRGIPFAMDSATDTYAIEDAVDRLLAPSRPLARRRSQPEVALAADPDVAPVPPVEDRIHSDAAFTRIVMIVPRHGGPDAGALRDRVLADGARRADHPDDAPHMTSGAGALGRWSVQAGADGAARAAFVEVLDWRDLADDALPDAVRRGYGVLARTAWTYLSTGAIGRLMRLSRRATLAAISRGGILALQAVLALFVGVVGGRTIASVLTEGTGALGLPDWPANFIAGFAGTSAVALVLRLFRAREDRLRAYDRLRGLAYLASANGAYPAELEERIAAFGRRIGWALRQPVDEVLVVGHGDGAGPAVSAVAEAVRWGDLPDGAPALSLLTLGHQIPLAGFLPKAARLRADLRDVSLRGDICWVDVSDPADAHAFALCDPVAVCGVALDDRSGPLVIASGFSRRRGEGLRDRIADHPLGVHDHYFDAPAGNATDYDWLRVLLGPLPLRTLLGGRPPAAGRIDVRASGYASTARPRPEPEDDDED